MGSFKNTSACKILPLALILILAALPERALSGTNALSSSISMQLISAGKFVKGKPESRKSLYLKEFYIDKYEVTQGDFEKIMGKNLSFFKGPDRPVENVNWFEARDYCEKRGKRLPTEWEWEKAAKAGTTSKFYWGEE
ncbi:MAG: formylglycine-generating enzyme family protein, partial [Nitrospinales bacterium]